MALLIAATSLAFPATALAALEVDFRTPSRGAYCDYVPRGEIIEGGIENPRVSFLCWTPNDGFVVNTHATGRVSKGYATQRLRAFWPVEQVLDFGERWAMPGIRCVSRRSGLTCRNDAGHGFWLGRFRGYRVF